MPLSILRNLGAGLPDATDVHLYAQPIVELSSAEVVGYEMLARWEGEDTEEVFARARLNGTLPELCQGIIGAGLQLVPQIPKGMYLAINVTVELLRTIGTPERSRIQEVPAADRARLMLEVSEQSPGGLDDIYDLLMHLRLNGVRFAIDDVGSQYGNMYRVIHLNPDFLKIDRSVIQSVRYSAASRAFLKALVAIATELRMTLVAEGVETTEECQAVEKVGVRYAQGYLFAKPKPVEELGWVVTG